MLVMSRKNEDSIIVGEYELKVTEILTQKKGNSATLVIADRTTGTEETVILKKSESYSFGDSVHITLVEIRGDMIRIGIVAPKETPVHRKEYLLDHIKDELLSYGNKMFGSPDHRTNSAIEQITNLVQLQDLRERLPTAASWQELLSPLLAGRRKGRKR